MAVAHGTTLRSTTGFDNGTITFSFAPSGTPRGVVVRIAQENGATDQIASVTYGGVGMTRVLRAVNTGAAELGQVWIYFLGSGIPTGTQNVVVTTNPSTGADDYAFYVSNVTAATDTQVDSSNSAAPVSAGTDPSLAIPASGTFGGNVVIYYVLWSGLLSVITTVQSGGTHEFGNDFGADTMMGSRKTASSGTSTTMGYTASSDEYVHAAVAVREVIASSKAPVFASRTTRNTHLRR